MDTKYSDHHSKLGLYNNSLAPENDAKKPEILSMLASVLERSIHRNEKLIKRSRNKQNVTIFHGRKAPTLSIRQYIDRVFKYSECSPSCFVVAYVYMDRFTRQNGSFLVTSLSVHRLFAACALLAVKFLEDECISNAYFAKIGGVSCAEMNKLELKLLLALNYRLHVSLETFDEYCIGLEFESKVPSASSRHLQKCSIHSCGLKGGWFKKDRSRRDVTCDGYSHKAI